MAEGNVLDLGSVTTAGDADTDVEAGELIEADNEQGLVDLNRWNVSRPFCNCVPSWRSNRPPLHAPVPSLSSFTEAFDFVCLPPQLWGRLPKGPLVSLIFVPWFGEWQAQRAGEGGR